METNTYCIGFLNGKRRLFVSQEYPSDCCPDRCYERFPCLAGDHDSPFWQGWGALRIKTFRLIENKYFETAVIAMILISSLALALEDVHLKNNPVRNKSFP